MSLGPGPIDSLYSCTDEQRKRPLTWVGGLGCVVFCGLDVPIEGEELLGVVPDPGLTDELVTYQPELTWVSFHPGNLLCHGEGDLYWRESLIGGLDCLPESLCLGCPPDHLMGLGLVHPIEEAGLAISFVHLLPMEMDFFPVHHCSGRTYSHHD